MPFRNGEIGQVQPLQNQKICRQAADLETEEGQEHLKDTILKGLSSSTCITIT